MATDQTPSIEEIRASSAVEKLCELLGDVRVSFKPTRDIALEGMPPLDLENFVGEAQRGISLIRASRAAAVDWASIAEYYPHVVTRVQTLAMLENLWEERASLLSRVEADERRIKELEARVKDLKPRARQVTAETSDGFGPRPDLERVFCLNHFSFRRDEEEPPICEKAFAKGLYPCEFATSTPSTEERAE